MIELTRLEQDDPGFIPLIPFVERGRQMDLDGNQAESSEREP
jgi:hypothetical protein